jgi:hypothetical protein
VTREHCDSCDATIRFPSPLEPEPQVSRVTVSTSHNTTVRLVFCFDCVLGKSPQVLSIIFARAK